LEVAGKDASNPEDSATARFHATARMKTTLKTPTTDRIVRRFVNFNILKHLYKN
jgi:hypothetical protein